MRYWLAAAMSLTACGFDNFDNYMLDSGASKSSGGSGLGEATPDTGLTGGGSGGASGGSGSGGSSTGGGSGSCPDADGDGVDSCSGDCDDSDAATFPGAAESEDRPSLCMKDADGDGWGDADVSWPIEAGRDCDDNDARLTPEDVDGDGVSSCRGDCDDEDSARSPDNVEVPFDDVDSDCDGEDGGYGTSAAGGGGSGYPISDLGTVTSEASISACTSIYDITVTVDITHTYIGDLLVTLTGPSGGSVVLHNRTGSSADDIFGTYSTSSGTLTPAESLYAFVGEDGSGTWRLQVYDGVGGDTGQLDGWGLSLVCL